MSAPLLVTTVGLYKLVGNRTVGDDLIKAEWIKPHVTKQTGRGLKCFWKASDVYAAIERMKADGYPEARRKS